MASRLLWTSRSYSAGWITIPSDLMTSPSIACRSAAEAARCSRSRRLQSDLQVGRGIVPERDVQPPAGRLRIGPQQAGQADELRPLLHRGRPARDDALAQRSCKGQEVLASNEIEDDGIHHVIAVQVGVQDEVRGIAHMSAQVVDLREQLPVQFVTVTGFQAEQLLLEKPRSSPRAPCACLSSGGRSRVPARWPARSPGPRRFPPAS